MSFRTYGGYAYSENGWRIVNRDDCRIGATDLLYTDTAPLRNGHAASVLEAWLRWYDANVPGEIVSPVWGWSATNDVPNSNHLSGTALDINAPQYPFGGNRMRDSFPDRYRKIREGLELFEGVIFWGADWSYRDEMHFQLADGTAAGDGASDWLKDFCARRIKDGRLVTGGPVDVILEPVKEDVKAAHSAQTGEAAWLHDSDLRIIQVEQQIAKKWPQLGNRNVQEAVAEIVKKLGA